MGKALAVSVDDVFNRLTVIGPCCGRKYGARLFPCQCSCGNSAVIEVSACDLHRGHVRSCGCLIAEAAAERGQRVRGPNHPQWQGNQRIHSQGYISAWVGLDHPMADVNGYALEHRLVMAEKLGRRLSSDEIVHHKDEVKTNNHPDNLELTSQAEHNQLHSPVSAAVMAALQELGRPAAPAEIAEKAGLTNKQIWDSLQLLKGRNSVEKAGYGKWKRRDN